MLIIPNVFKQFGLDWTNMKDCDEMLKIVMGDVIVYKNLLEEKAQ